MGWQMTIAIANRLVQLRKANGFSQEELAARIGVSRQAVSKWERAEASPDTDNLILLARLYRVSLDDLLLAGESGSTVETDRREGAGSASADEKALPCANEAQTARQPADTGWNPLHSADGKGAVQPPPNEMAVEEDPDQARLEPGRLLIVRDEKHSAAPANGRTSRWMTFPYPVLVTLVYLAIGLIAGKWHPWWLLFLTIPLYYGLADLVLQKKRIQDFAYPVLVVIVYLLMGFLANWWHPGWVIFVTIPLYYSIADVITRRKSWRHFAYPVLTVLVFLILGICGHWWSWAWLVFLTVPLYYGLFPQQDES